MVIPVLHRSRRRLSSIALALGTAGALVLSPASAVGSALQPADDSASAYTTATAQHAPERVSGAGPAFYGWTADIPAPGTLLRIGDYSGTAPADASTRLILYSTTRADGSPAVASAVVAIPDAATATERTVLAWQHGTTGVAQACAPSLTDIALTPEAIPGIDRAIDRGWVVVATDYPGQGTAGRYPFLIGEGEGRSTLDGIRAVGQLPEADAGRDALLWGHSQGGHATLFADQIAATYAPELRIRGVAALSAAADPMLMARRVLGPDAGALSAVIASYVLVPYADEYPDVVLEDYVTPGLSPLVQSFAAHCTSDPAMALSVLSASVVNEVVPVIDADLDDSPAARRLTENIASGDGTAPLFLGQGTEDEVVPIDSQRELVPRAQASGRSVTVHEYEGGTHMGVIAADSPLIDDLFGWADALGV
ncbi:lipase family protein [uncultured Corynebacterium sp.]|uniref:lipase family protein n=1 Tax=uncultured Corynebacterium sp. TaxID=159447 RepID=UPI0025F1DC1D|nr:lipase family protein [uncultured Corynebacterium sp.]